MDARRLVGMTMGARKRAARLVTPHGYHASHISARKRAAAEARAPYRLGERLRPCPWRDHEACAAIGESTPGLPACDGSGVLPAKVRRAKVR